MIHRFQAYSVGNSNYGKDVNDVVERGNHGRIETEDGLAKTWGSEYNFSQAKSWVRAKQNKISSLKCADSSVVLEWRGTTRGGE